MTTNTGTDYKAMFESSEKIRKSDAVLAEHREELWRGAYSALLDATDDGDADDWRAATRRLLEIVEEQASDIAMYKQMLSQRDVILDESMKKTIREHDKAAIEAVKKGFKSIFDGVDAKI